MMLFLFSSQEESCLCVISCDADLSTIDSSDGSMSVRREKYLRRNILLFFMSKSDTSELFLSSKYVLR